MSEPRAGDKAKAAIALLLAEHGEFPTTALLELAWLRGYTSGLDKAEDIIRETHKDEHG